VKGIVHAALDGIDEQALFGRIDPESNTVAWLVWHLTRVQDDHVADAARREQIWHAGGWVERFDLPLEPDATGYGASPDDVAAVRADRSLLVGYHDAVHAASVDYLSGLGGADLNAVVDPNWDPPVTLGVRLVSVLSDDLQHAGQAAYVRGVLERRG
jgi:hypothetical protein